MPSDVASSAARRHQQASDPEPHHGQARQLPERRPLSSNLHSRLTGTTAPLESHMQVLRGTTSDGHADEADHQSNHNQLPSSQLALHKYLSSRLPGHKQRQQTEAFVIRTPLNASPGAPQSSLQTRQRINRGGGVASSHHSPRTPHTAPPTSTSPLRMTPAREDSGSSGSEFSDHRLSSHAPALHAHMQQSLLKQQLQRRQLTGPFPQDDSQTHTNRHQLQDGGGSSSGCGSSSSPESVRHWSVFRRPSPQETAAAPARPSPRTTIQPTPRSSPPRQPCPHDQPHPSSHTAVGKAANSAGPPRPHPSLTQRLHKMAAALGRVSEKVGGMRGGEVGDRPQQGGGRRGRSGGSSDGSSGSALPQPAPHVRNHPPPAPVRAHRQVTGWRRGLRPQQGMA
ncbi:MAG: hypothetical protein WDW36_009208 [Sanguina aurantia]